MARRGVSSKIAPLECMVAVASRFRSSRLRVWVAGCAVMLIIAAVVALLGERRLGPLAGIGIGLLMFILVVAATILFNWQGKAVFAARSHDDYVRALEEQGKLELHEFRATRAFQVEEFEDEGSHYFLELDDRSVLYLTGQYLYEYEPMEADEDEPATFRRFPCTSFTVRTNLHDGYTVDLLCEGDVLEPEVVAPPFSRSDHRRGLVPTDRTIITDRSYDELKAERPSTA